MARGQRAEGGNTPQVRGRGHRDTVPAEGCAHGGGSQGEAPFSFRGAEAKKDGLVVIADWESN